MQIQPSCLPTKATILISPENLILGLQGYVTKSLVIKPARSSGQEVITNGFNNIHIGILGIENVLIRTLSPRVGAHLLLATEAGTRNHV